MASRASEGKGCLVTCYVDRLQQYPTKIRCFVAGSCHLIADTLDELHAMAKRLGLKRAWFQDAASCPHYDLTASKREAAIAAGAVDSGRAEFVDHMRRIRATGRAAS